MQPSLQDIRVAQYILWDYDAVDVLSHESGYYTNDNEAVQSESNTRSDDRSEQLADDNNRSPEPSQDTRSSDISKQSVQADGLSSQTKSVTSVYATRDRGFAESVVCTSEYQWSCEWAIAVIYCESRYDYTAIGHEVINGVDYYFVGWFQVISGSSDPYINTDQAYKQWLEWQSGQRTRSPWPNCGY